MLSILFKVRSCTESFLWQTSVFLKCLLLINYFAFFSGKKTPFHVDLFIQWKSGSQWKRILNLHTQKSTCMLPKFRFNYRKHYFWKLSDETLGTPVCFRLDFYEYINYHNCFLLFFFVVRTHLELFELCIASLTSLGFFLIT